jgi:ABC-type transport system involved in multi-copper enzyme maturation permease subunit
MMEGPSMLGKRPAGRSLPGKVSWGALRPGINPIIVKELRSRMRGVRPFATLTLTLLFMSGVSYLLFQMVMATARYSGTPLSPLIGQSLFAGLVLLELMLVSSITPAVTAGAISGEQEKLTYEMLLSTPMRPASILWGKLFSAMSYVLLLFFAGIPLASLVFIFGGVAPREMIKALLLLLAIAVMFGVIGLFFSSLFGRTGRSTVASYITIAAMLFGPLFLSFAIGVWRQTAPPRWLLVPSPFSALISAITPSMNTNGYNIFSMFGGIFFGFPMDQPVSQTGIPRPLYHYSLPLFGLLTLVLYLVATRLVQPARRWRIGWKGLLQGVGLVGLYCALVGYAFWSSSGRYESVRSIFGIPTPVPPAIFEAPAAREVLIPAEEVIQAYPEPDGSPTPTALTGDGTYPFPGGTPTPLPPPAPESSGEWSTEDQAVIYSLVTRQLYTVDHTFGNTPPNWQVVYLVQTTDDGASGDPNLAPMEPALLTDAVQQDIVANLGDLPAKFIWVDQAGDAPTDPDTGMVEGGLGVIITFGNIHAQPDGSVLVPASLYFGNLGAGGKTYILGQVDGVWRITGTTGVEWIS